MGKRERRRAKRQKRQEERRAVQAWCLRERARRIEEERSRREALGEEPSNE